MTITSHADPPGQPLPEPNWVTSMGGPLIVLPVSALQEWGGTELLTGAENLLADPATPWEHGAVWETDGASVLMDSAEAGDSLNQPYPHNMQLPEQAPVDIPAGRWKIRAFHKTGDFPWVGVVQLIPEQPPDPATSAGDTTLASQTPYTAA